MTVNTIDKHYEMVRKINIDYNPIMSKAEAEKRFAHLHKYIKKLYISYARFCARDAPRIESLKIVPKWGVELQRGH